ncbi:MAG: CehA/McbA family metallohydrolase, partial [Planctomyces sp.]
FVVTTVHGACDFISAVDTPAIWELNVWYHTLNCGMTTRISGETDFPCIYGDRVGLGRVYVSLPKSGELTYDAWVEGLRDGRSYCGDGLSHILDLRVNGVGVGERTAAGVSRLDLAEPGEVEVTFDAAALLEPEPGELTESIRNRRLDDKPYWHIERCRIGNSRKVPVEVIVNGNPVAVRELTADGHIESFRIPVKLEGSSWIAVRILPSVHTNPIFVHTAGQPVRGGRGSAEWCLQAVDVCWNSKRERIREDERPAAEAAYQHAREVYQAIVNEYKQAEQGQKPQ